MLNVKFGKDRLHLGSSDNGWTIIAWLYHKLFCEPSAQVS